MLFSLLHKNNFNKKVSFMMEALLHFHLVIKEQTLKKSWDKEWKLDWVRGERRGKGPLLTDLWEDVWRRSIPLIVLGHFFSLRIRHICSECIKGEGDSKGGGRASTRQFTARSGVRQRGDFFVLRTSEDVESLWCYDPLCDAGKELMFIHKLLVSLWQEDHVWETTSD